MIIDVEERGGYVETKYIIVRLLSTFNKLSLLKGARITPAITSEAAVRIYRVKQRRDLCEPKKK